MIVLDTNIVIAYFGGETHIVEKIDSAVINGETIIVPTIVIAETLAYPQIDASLTARIHHWLATGVIVNVFDLPLAEKAAAIRRETKLKLTDSAIAATAIVHGASLATRDQQFKKVSDLTILEW